MVTKCGEPLRRGGTALLACPTGTTNRDNMGFSERLTQVNASTSQVHMVNCQGTQSLYDVNFQGTYFIWILKSLVC